jgi:hypothetical protein
MIVDVGGRTEGVIAGRELKLEGKLLDKKAGMIFWYMLSKQRTIKVR